MFWKNLILIFFIISNLALAQTPNQPIPLRLRKKEPPPPHFKVLSPFKMFPIENVFSIHLLKNYYGKEDGLLLFRPKLKLTGIYKLKEEKLRYLKRMAPRAFIARAETFTYKGETRLVLGYEFHAKEENKWKEREMVIFTIYDRELNKSKDIFERISSTPKVNFMKQQDEKLWINYFHENDFSQGGFLSKTTEGWKFTKTFDGWKQDSVDIDNGAIIVGSRYSDDQERAKELRMFKDRVWTSLPSEKGVNFVRYFQFDNDPELEIVMIDGLPNTADKRARPQLAYVNKVNGEYQRFKIDDIGRSQTDFREVQPFDFHNKKYLLVTGDLYIDLYSFENNKWNRKRLYRRKDRNSEAKLQTQPLISKEGKLAFAILDDTEVMMYWYLSESSNNPESH